MQEKTVWGLDVSKDNVCAHKLTCFPIGGVNGYWENHYRYLKTADFNEFFPRFYINPKKKDQQGIREWLTLVKPEDIIIMEPTGVHMAYVWAKAASNIGAQVIWVGHAQLAGYRAGKNMPEKSDAADAYCLACYWHDPEHKTASGEVDQRWFLSFNIENKLYPLAQATAYLRHLNRSRHPNKVYLRLLLTWQFPEAAYVQARVSKNTSVSPLYAWVAGEHSLMTGKGLSRYKRMWDESIAQDLDIGPDWFTRQIAKWMCDSDQAETQILEHMENLVSEDCFKPYLEVFESFGMSIKEYAPLLIAIFPFESFLDNGKRRKINGVDRSLRAFKHRIGQGGFFKVSGQSGKYLKGGSGNCRQQTWLWIYRCIVPKRYRPTDGLGKELADYYADLEIKFAPGTPERERVLIELRQQREIKNKGGQRKGGRFTGQNVITGLLIAKTQARAANILYRELCKKFCRTGE